VDVIGHEAIGQNFNSVLSGLQPEPGEIGSPIHISKEHLTAPVSALDNVVWNSGADESQAASHATNLPTRTRRRSAAIK
jgi:hypothetical protein